MPWADATLHVLSHGLHYGSAVFEGERAYGGVIVKTEAQSRRFRRSAELLDFEIPYSEAELEAAKRAVVATNGEADAYVRPVARRGSEMMAVAADIAAFRRPDPRTAPAWTWPSMFDMATKMKFIRLGPPMPRPPGSA